MSAPQYVSDHARNRTIERFDSLDIDKTIASLPSLVDGSHFLSANSTTTTQQENFRLLYVKELDIFLVLVVQTDLENGAAVLHTLVTIYTVDIYQQNNRRIISNEDYSKAAKAVMGPVEHRIWSKMRFMQNPIQHSNRLLVGYSKNGKPFNLNVRKFACTEFKKFSNPYDILTHPGVITGANAQLAKFGKSLADRYFMRFDGHDGQLQLLGRVAKKCPYCGMEPLETDVLPEKNVSDNGPA